MSNERVEQLVREATKSLEPAGSFQHWMFVQVNVIERVAVLLFDGSVEKAHAEVAPIFRKYYPHPAEVR